MKHKSSLLHYYRSITKAMARNTLEKSILFVGPTGEMAVTTVLFYTLVLLVGSASILVAAQSNPAQSLLTPMNCSSPSQSSCTSYLYFVGSETEPLSEIASYFNVDSTSILLPGPAKPPLYEYMIAKTCSCNGSTGAPGSQFLANAWYVPTEADVDLNVSDISREYYDGLVYLPSNEVLTPDVSIELQLICGCPTAGWTSTITYIVKDEDTVDQLVEEFDSNRSAVQKLNNLSSVNLIKIGQNLFIPTNFTPSVAASEPGVYEQSKSHAQGKSHGLAAGIITGSAVIFVLALIAACVLWVRRVRNHGAYARSVVDHSGQGADSGSRILKRSYGGFGFISNLFSSLKTRRDRPKKDDERSSNLSREAMDLQEKPIVFDYKEIIRACDHFAESKKVGQGSYGAVYAGVLRQQKVAIKQMKTAKLREFYAELKVLCKVHHSNLVELIGYSSGDESLVLVYEFAENGALSDHLHNTDGEGSLALSWTTRVEIALDVARGLEYIHDHTKAQYVHRDVKSSNILLDGLFRAKVADFGLAKLVEQNSEHFMSKTRIVGTFGYMAPEYIQGGHTTTKSDVYSFGVVLFELITGRKAMSEDNSGRLSIVSFMLDTLKEERDPKKRFERVVDQRLGKCFPLEGAFEMAKLARSCVEEDPENRPPMRTLVFRLSQCLLDSIEWEAAYGGRSQIFSGLTQGR